MAKPVRKMDSPKEPFILQIQNSTGGCHHKFKQQHQSALLQRNFLK
jgi:hypothetical protein